MSMKLSVKKLWLLIPLQIIGLLILTCNLIIINYRQEHHQHKLSLGISFSQKYARELDLDWRQAYTATLTELNVDKVRLMSYWDEHQPAQARYDFKDLDWLMNQAHRHGVEVNLVVGLRQPRWPECHMPKWAQSLDETLQNQHLLKYLGKVIKRYRTSPALAGWQLENESSNNLFGNCPDWNRQFYQAEFDLVRQLDTKHPIFTNVSNQIGIPLRGPVGDKVGFSVYRHATPKVFNRSFKWSYWYIPTHWHSLRAALTENIQNTQAYIHELQAEPWGAVATAELSIDTQNQLMNPAKLVGHVEYALRTGMDEIYLWGAEWWYWRKAQFNDPAMWQTAQTILAAAQNRYSE